MTVRLIISGKVQGVFFRASTKDQAVILDVKGWVKNTADGKVEILASGSDSSVNKFIEWCRQGPPQAKVTKVDILREDEKKFERFSILR